MILHGLTSIKTNHVITYKLLVIDKNTRNHVTMCINEEWMNVRFLQNTSWVQNVSREKLYLPRQNRTMNETLFFPQKFITRLPASFPFVEESPKLFGWWGGNMHCRISHKVHYVLKPFLLSNLNDLKKKPWSIFAHRRLAILFAAVKITVQLLVDNNEFAWRV